MVDAIQTKDDTRTRVLLAAGPIFAEKGYEGATVREICDAAGANLASVNYHFGDKKALYIETIKQVHARRLTQTPSARWDAGTPPEEKLRRFVRVLLTRMLSENEAPWQFRLMMQEMQRPIGACEALVEEFIRPEFQQLQSILDDMLPSSVEVADRYRIAFSIVGQCLFYKMGRHVATGLAAGTAAEGGFELEALIEHVTRFSLASLQMWCGGPTGSTEQTDSADPSMPRLHTEPSSTNLSDSAEER